MAKSPTRLRKFLGWVIQLLLWPLISCLVLSYLSPFISPDKAWWISFFGLAYPIFLLSAIGFMVVFLLTKSRRIYSIGLVLILGLPLHIRYFSLGWSAEQADYPNDNTLRVMSYNVRLFNYYEWLDEDRNTSRDSIYAHIRAVQPDVICFQEYLTVQGSNFIRNNDIRDLGDYRYYTEKYSIAKANRRIGIATFSKYPILHSELVEYDNTSKQFAVFTDIVKENDTVRVYNIHLQSIRIQQDDYDFLNNEETSNEDAKNGIKRMIQKLKYAYPLRATQAVSIVQHAQSSPYPVVICGDFNDTPMSYVYNAFNSSFEDAFRGNYLGLGSTYAGKLPAGRIDYIFHSSALEAISFSVQDQAHSDHYSIHTDLIFRQ